MIGFFVLYGRKLRYYCMVFFCMYLNLKNLELFMILIFLISLVLIFMIGVNYILKGDAIWMIIGGKILGIKIGLKILNCMKRMLI